MEEDHLFNDDAFEVIARARLNSSTIPEVLMKPVYEPVRKLVAKYLDKLEIRARRLVYLDKDKSVRDNNGVRFYVPVSNRRKVLRIAHHAPQAGHLGIQKSLNRLNHAWWPGMSKDEWLIKCCNRFQRNKLIHNLDGEMLIPETHGVWSRVYVNLNGLLPVTARNNKYILVVADSRSKFTVLVPLQV